MNRIESLARPIREYLDGNDRRVRHEPVARDTGLLVFDVCDLRHGISIGSVSVPEVRGKFKNKFSLRHLAEFIATDDHEQIWLADLPSANDAAYSVELSGITKEDTLAQGWLKFVDGVAYNEDYYTNPQSIEHIVILAAMRLRSNNITGVQ